MGFRSGKERAFKDFANYIVLYSWKPRTETGHDRQLCGKEMARGIVYWEEDYPNLLFAKDGEIFDLDGKQTIVIGGAYSIDKMIRVIYGYGWWADEQPSDEIKRYVEEQLEKNKRIFGRS